ncbi:MAG: AAA family ATPase [Alphaproteobacteria bacterium]|nr:AAA family ATPase [Alphaproteobacteria bacterium]
MAHLIVVGNHKGGAGKSTVAMHVAIALLRMGKRTGCLDLDTKQRSLTRYIENRASYLARRGGALPQPQYLPIRESAARQLDDAEVEDGAVFATAIRRMSDACDFIVIDSPGADTQLSRLAHAHADTLITPLNDSFIDFDLLGAFDPDAPDVVRPSVYSEMVWESRKRKAQTHRRPIDWVVMRNRTSASRIEAKNKQKVGDALKALSSRIGFRLSPGLSERVIFRELFPQGLTLLDLDAEGGEGELRMTHIAARQELRDMFIALKLPGLEGEPLRF